MASLRAVGIPSAHWPTTYPPRRLLLANGECADGRSPFIFFGILVLVFFFVRLQLAVYVLQYNKKKIQKNERIQTATTAHTGIDDTRAKYAKTFTVVVGELAGAFDDDCEDLYWHFNALHVFFARSQPDKQQTNRLNQKLNHSSYYLIRVTTRVGGICSKHSL